MTKNEKSKEIIDLMMKNDAFSKWLGINIVSYEPGEVILQMTIKKDMLNGFGIAHGGITYALADSALAFAANGFGKKSVSIETSISHIAQLKEFDVITAIVQKKNSSKRIGVYHVDITNQKKELIASFKGTVYITEKEWDA